MNIKEVLLERHSKDITSSIIDYIYDNPTEFESVFQLFLCYSNPIVRQRAAWVIGHIGVDSPSYIMPYLEQLVDNFTKKGHHNAIYRNTVRVLQSIKIPTELQGKVVTTCFDMVSNSKTAIAIKAFSMTILYKISNDEHDLKHELKLVLEDLLPNASKGEKGKANKILSLLNKELN